MGGFQKEGLVYLPNHAVICYRPEHLLYHSSWDWLMSVVEKIESLVIYQKEQGGSFLIKFALLRNATANVVIISCPALAFKLIRVENACKITAVWLAIIEFINWYNQNKKL